MSSVQDKEIVELMARNRRGRFATAAAGLTFALMTVVATAFYFGSVAAVAP